ncbi:MAG: ATP-binding protein [Actinobacteria bacterium]|nr:MAG: ATP-binding protein [Actinomycetota bacterium]
MEGRLTRHPGNRIVAGVCAGVAARLGIGASYVRAAFVVLSFAALVGVALYLVLWLGTPEAATTGSVLSAEEPPGRTRILGMIAIYAAALLILDAIGLWFGDWAWPLALLTFGAAAILDRGSTDYGPRLVRLTKPPEGGGPVRPRVVQIGFGIALMLGGLALVSSSIDRFQAIGPFVFAVALTAAGFMLAFGPWAWRLTADLAAERRRRIRSEERAGMAAHLHDSVLQTLALIQRSEDPKKMVTLARAQERELRAWLYDGRVAGAETLRGAIQAAASRVEAGYDMPVDVVFVGDYPIDEETTAIVQAAAEAMANAARHSGAAQVSVFVEASPEAVDVFVGDQGSGFDPESVPADRRGIDDSIRARMARAGGTATITTSLGEGTEVHLRKEWP